jgi:tetraacyldisaccharide 4'-kinase
MSEYEKWRGSDLGHVDFFERLDRPSPGPLASVAATALAGLEVAYAAGLSSYLCLERVGLRRRTVTPVPVISIGNLSVGGTGKTPATIEVARMLQDLGYRPAILSRGHGGSASSRSGIVSNGSGDILLDVVQSGDEPMMLAKALPGVPVLVGKDRRKTATIAVREFSPDLLILDDGFQYWQLYRDLDIVLLDSHIPFANSHCLPRGLLREPMKNLNRAKVVLITRASDVDEEQRSSIVREVSLLAPSAHVFFADHLPGNVLRKNPLAHLMQEPLAPLAISGIASPHSFALSLSRAGIGPVETMSFADHHFYDAADATRIVGKMTNVGAQSIITTEKDFVKMDRLLQGVPIFTLPVDFTIWDQQNFARTVVRGSGLTNYLEREASVIC